MTTSSHLRKKAFEGLACSLRAKLALLTVFVVAGIALACIIFSILPKASETEIKVSQHNYSRNTMIRLFHNSTIIVLLSQLFCQS
jgi:uncharacterized membrane protein